MDLWLFRAIAVVLAGMVALILVQALRRGGAVAETAEDHPDLKVYRDQLAEVERDLQRGTLAAEEGQRLRVEVSRRLLEADRAVKAAAAPAPRGSLIWAAVVVLAVVIGALALYRQLGAEGYPYLSLSTRLAMADARYQTRPSQAQAVAETPARAPATPDAEFTALMEKLRAAVAARPDDPKGLELLARNEAALGNFEPALTAQRQLLAVLGTSASPAQRLAEAEMMVAEVGGYVSPEAEAILITVLERDPQNGMARYLSGLMFAQVGRPDRAFQMWKPLLDEGPADAPWVQAVKIDIQAVAEQAGIRFALPGAKGPAMADMQAASEMSAEDRQAMIEGMVGQLEGRLLSEGGSVEEWLKLMNALGVLGQPDRGRAALAAAEKALAADPAALDQIRAAAQAAGFAP